MLFDPKSVSLTDDGQTVSFAVPNEWVFLCFERSSQETTIELPLSDARLLHAALGGVLAVADSERKTVSTVEIREEQAKEADGRI